jgi:hypothetical protein
VATVISWPVVRIGMLEDQFGRQIDLLTIKKSTYGLKLIFTATNRQDNAL